MNEFWSIILGVVSYPLLGVLVAALIGESRLGLDITSERPYDKWVAFGLLTFWPIVLVFWFFGWIANTIMDVADSVGLYRFDGYRLWAGKMVRPEGVRIWEHGCVLCGRELPLVGKSSIWVDDELREAHYSCLQDANKKALIKGRTPDEWIPILDIGTEG